MRRLKWVKRVVAVVGMFAIAVVTFFSINVANKAKAASTGYFNDYIKLATVEQGDGYDGIQGMSVYGEWAYYAKLQIKNGKETGKCGIWAYNLETGQKIKVYNGKRNKAVFKIGHANCLFVNSNYLYIASGDANMGVIRYNIDHQGNRVNLTNKKTFKLYSERCKRGEKLPVSGIEYAGRLNAFILKCGNYIYLGEFNENYFAYHKRFEIEQQVAINSRDEVLDLSPNVKFVRQSMYYDNGILYLPMSSKNNLKQSIVVGFRLDEHHQDNDILNSIDNSIVRITSTRAYPHLFEIEAVDNYKGKMIMAVNCRKEVNGKAVGEDIIAEVKTFDFNGF